MCIAPPPNNIENILKHFFHVLIITAREKKAMETFNQILADTINKETLFYFKYSYSGPNTLRDDSAWRVYLYYINSLLHVTFFQYCKHFFMTLNFGQEDFSRYDKS